MTTNQTQSSYKFFIDINVNNKIKKTYCFSEKATAYYFFVTSLKSVARLLTDDDEAFLSGILYSYTKNNKKLIHTRQNLTKVYF